MGICKRPGNKTNLRKKNPDFKEEEIEQIVEQIDQEKPQEAPTAEGTLIDKIIKAQE